MRTLLDLTFVLVLSACVTDVEEDSQRDDNAVTEQPADMPPYGDGDGYGDPCSIDLAFEPSGDLLSVPAECVTSPEIDNGDPPPDAEEAAEQMIQPH